MSDGTVSSQDIPATPAAGVGGQPGGEPAPQANGQGGGFQVPGGHRLVSDADYEKFQRYGQQVSGFREWGQRLSAAGLKDPADLDGLVELRDTLSKRGVDRQAFLQAFADPQPQGGAAEFDPEALLTQAEERAFNRLSRESAMAEHRKAREAEPERIVSAMSGDERFKGLPKSLLTRVAKAVALEANDIRGVYDDGPLRHEALRPLDDAGIAKAVERVAAELVADTGAELHALGQKAAAGRAAPSQDAGGGGAPGTTGSTDPRGMPTRDAIAASMERARQRRGGGAASSLAR